MKKNVMSLKATVNNIAKKSKVSAQSVLQTYMLERLLERISVSKYKDNFILKGGMLISAMLGIDSRTTMDIDTTIKGFELTEENVKKIMEDVCSIDLQADPTEMRNIYGQPGTEDIVKELKTELTALQEQYDDPVRFSPERDKE
mgnify:CR=1 FL=1